MLFPLYFPDNKNTDNKLIYCRNIKDDAIDFAGGKTE